MYTRVKRWGALPRPGGLQQQPEKLMQALEVVDEAFAEEESAKNELKAAQAAARSGGGHHFVRRRRRQ